MRKLEYRIKEINDRFSTQKQIESFEWKYPNLLCKFLGIFGAPVQVGWKYADVDKFGEICLFSRDSYCSLENAINQIKKWIEEPKYHYL